MSMGDANAVRAASSAVAIGQVAQLVEQGTENPRVGGSIPSLAILFLSVGLIACGDRCERLCADVAERIEECRGAEPWSDFGASRNADWVNRCQSEWDGTSGGLTTRELELALAICAQSQTDLEAMPCDDVIALYGAPD
jgi:hypothetical protein